MKKLFLLSLMAGVIIAVAGCSTKLVSDGVDPKIHRYLAYNVWYEKPDNVWSTNYKTGMVVPAGTPVSNVRIGYKRSHKLVAFSVPSMGDTEFIIHFTKAHHGNLSFSAFKKRMFTTKTFKEMSKGFSKDEIEAITSPRPFICKGMSKRAVIMAWGYPPEVATPATTLNIWKYWINRYRTILVYFNKKGRVIQEVQPL